MMYRFRSAFTLLLISAAAVSIPAQGEDTVWMSLFNGENLTGWTGYEGNWRADSGMIRASGPTVFNANTFIWYDTVFSDFVLKLKGRMQWNNQYANSGIQCRSRIADRERFIMTGYQYELDQIRWGYFRGESCCNVPRGLPYDSWFYGPTQECLDALDPQGWNDMEMALDGQHLWTYLNGEFCGEILDADWYSAGNIGLQYHAPGNFPLDFKDIYIRPLNNSFEIPNALKVILGPDGTPADRPVGVAEQPQWRLSGSMLKISNLPEHADVSIYGCSGKRVKRIENATTNPAGAFELDMAGLAEGVYYVRTEGAAGRNSSPSIYFPGR